MHVMTLDVVNVSAVCFVNLFLIVKAESEDENDSELHCYNIEEMEEGLVSKLTVKRFMQAECIIKPHPWEQSIVFTCGNEIGRVNVPELDLMYQSSSGHTKGINDFTVNEMCIFTTGGDSSLRVFDIDNGMELLEPMADMECDKLEREGDFVFARCGEGTALLIFRF